MSDKKQKTVGIIGGMGPEATVELMRRVIELTPAKDDCDHIHMLVDNNPKVPSRIKALIDGDGESPVPTLIKMAQGLEIAGADFLVMPCHTAHHYYSEISEAISIPFINLIELAVKNIKSEFPRLKKIGLLASTAVINIKLYENAFSELGIETIYPRPDEQEALMKLIKAVKSKTTDKNQTHSFKDLASSLEVACKLIACTELSILGNTIYDPSKIIDALDLLAKEIVAQAT